MRNLDRLVPILREKEYVQYLFIADCVHRLYRRMEKASLWLVHTAETKNFDPVENMQITYTMLRDLKRMCIYKHQVDYDPETGGFEFERIESDRSANKFIQELFRNLKVYDCVIFFITGNLSLFNQVADKEELEDDEAEFEGHQEQHRWARKVFKACFTLLTAFVSNNPINQKLMWKYKEFFVFPHLGKTEHMGELDFVFQILNKSPYI